MMDFDCPLGLMPSCWEVRAQTWHDVSRAIEKTEENDIKMLLWYVVFGVEHEHLPGKYKA